MEITLNLDSIRSSIAGFMSWLESGMGGLSEFAGWASLALVPLTLVAMLRGARPQGAALLVDA